MQQICVVSAGSSASDMCRGRRLVSPEFRHDDDNRADGVGAKCRRQPVEPGRRRSPSRDAVRDVNDAAACCRTTSPSAAAAATGLYHRYYIILMFADTLPLVGTEHLYGGHQMCAKLLSVNLATMLAAKLLAIEPFPLPNSGRSVILQNVNKPVCYVTRFAVVSASQNVIGYAVLSDWS